jgi:hypothetical protein
MAMGSRARGRLLRDLAGAGSDLDRVAQRHRLSREQLATWMDRPENRRALAALCRAADLHAELALSRYRVHAATRLVQIAASAEAKKGDETIRRACQGVLTLQPPALRRERAADDAEEAALDAELARVLAAIDEGAKPQA